MMHTQFSTDCGKMWPGWAGTPDKGVLIFPDAMCAAMASEHQWHCRPKLGGAAKRDYVLCSG